MNQVIKTDEALDKYSNFIYKYVNMFHQKTIDFSNYDIRYFLSIYMNEKKSRASLRRGKFRSSQDVSNAYAVLHYLTQAFQGYTKNEIYHELIIPFLETLSRYEDQGIGYEKYLYAAYKYNLVRHLNTLLFQVREKLVEEVPEHIDFFPEEETENMFFMGYDMELNNPLWLNGSIAEEPFNSFTKEERIIIVQYYMHGKTDIDIARQLGRSRRTINRQRNDLVNMLKDQVDKGEIKCLRWIQF